MGVDSNEMGGGRGSGGGALKVAAGFWGVVVGGGMGGGDGDGDGDGEWGVDAAWAGGGESGGRASAASVAWAWASGPESGVSGGSASGVPMSVSERFGLARILGPNGARVGRSCAVDGRLVTGCGCGGSSKSMSMGMRAGK